MNDPVNSEENGNDEVEAQSKPSTKSKPIRVLPTDRLVYEKQLSIIRAYGAASGADKQLTTNADVAKIADISSSSISMTNPFLIDVGLIVREGMKQRPTQVVMDYCAAWEWNKDTAGQKLASAFSATWFAKALLPKLSFRSMTIDEAVSFLADDAKASIEYKDQLTLLLQYLATAGLIVMEGNTVAKGNGKRDPETPPPPAQEKKIEQNDPAENNSERFAIPLPNKSPAIIIVPKNLDADDWEMLTQMMTLYVKRWKSNIIKE